VELEKVDATVQSMKKLTTGTKSLREGFDGLQNLAPPVPAASSSAE